MKSFQQKVSESNVQKSVKPGPIGGSLIRRWIAFLREQGCSLPFSSHILIAISGGSDSVGLAHFLIHYGKRILPKKKISLLHIDHQWREQSGEDRLWIQQLAQTWEVPLYLYQTVPLLEYPRGESVENYARQLRKAIYQKAAKQYKAMIWTAHQADDLAETVLWRLFTGTWKTHLGGILFSHGVEMRPFLCFRKQEIQNYLREEGMVYREDPTNVSIRFLRARLRNKLMPEMERLFPKAVDNLNQMAWDFQKEKRQELSKLIEFPESIVLA